MNQTIDEIERRKDPQSDRTDAAATIHAVVPSGGRKGEAVTSPTLPAPEIGEASGEGGENGFAPVLSFDPVGRNVENLIYKPSDAQPAPNRNARLEQEISSLADIYGVPKEQEEQFMESAAPIITPMTGAGEPEEPAMPVRRRVTGGESLAFRDLSGRRDLQPEEIDEASEIFGIKYPAGFRTDLVHYEGREIDLSDFSLVENLRWRDIEKAAKISGIVFPSTIDTDSFAFYDRDISGCDFSAVYGLRWRHIQTASDIAAIKYPATFDIDNAEFAARSISGSDFSLIANLRWEHIMGASDIRGIKYPASFDLSTARFYGRDISGSDFSLCRELTWEDIRLAANLTGVIYPAEFDLSVCDFTDYDVSGSDFSKLRTFDWNVLQNAAAVNDIKYPASFDANTARFEGIDISGGNFSRVDTLRFAHIRPAAGIRRLVYPPRFDIDDADYTDRDIDGSDFSLLQGFNWDSVRLALSRENVRYPAGFVEPVPSDEDIEGAMLIYLLRLYSRVASGENFDTRGFYKDITVLYPGLTDADAASLIERSTAKWERSNGNRLIRQDARSAHTGDKLFMTKLGFRLLYPVCGGEQAADILRESFGEIMRRKEKEKFEQRLYDLQCGKYLSAAELSDIGFHADQLPQKAEVPLPPDEQHAKRVMPVPFDFPPELEDEEEEDEERGVSRVRAVPMTEPLVPEEEPKKVSPLAIVADRVKVRVAQTEAPIIAVVKKQTPSEEIPDQSDREEIPDSQEEAIPAETVDVPVTVINEPTVNPPIVIDEPIHEEPVESVIEPLAAVEEEPPEEEPVMLPPPAEDFGRVAVETLLPEQEEEPDASAVSHSFGSHIVMPEEELGEPDVTGEPSDSSEDIQPTPPEYRPLPTPPVFPARPEPPEPKDDVDEPSPVAEDIGVKEDVFVPVQVDVSALRDSAINPPEDKIRRKTISDEEKAIRTGVMGMLLYINQGIADSELTNSELFSEFMRIYPGAQPKETAAMAQFAANTLGGINEKTRAKLFMFATKASPEVKKKLLDFALEQFSYKLRVPEDEATFREFLHTLCVTLFEDAGDYEYSSYLSYKGILKDPPAERDVHYKRIPFDRGVGKANLYANTGYPFYRTLEQVGFLHFTFEAIRDSLKIELSDNHYYEELENLVYRKCEPSLMKFIVIETTMGLLYLEQRTLRDWGVDEEFVWRAAEGNMKAIRFRERYSFSTEECSPFRTIQHDLASYVLCLPEKLKELSDGRDLILTAPCREIVYIDYYDFSAIREMLSFSAHYDCSIQLGGDTYEHPFTPDVFIFHYDDGSLERVNDETYILLGDSVARRQVLRSVLPQDIRVDPQALVRPLTTDEVEIIGDDNYNLQAAAFTILRLYSKLNGDDDYTRPQNALMAVFDDVFISFDAVYPPAKGREQPDPLRHIDEAARMVARGGKTVSWLLVQAIQSLCGDINYETKASSNIRHTVLREIYGDSANAVWLSCATATEYRRRYEAVRIFHEIPVENQRLTILDAKVEVAMHALVMIFHQFGQRYALGQVRRHLYKMLPNIKFCYEINQSAWLPALGDDIDVDVQSIGMIFRGFDNATQENILKGLANAIGDRDLADGGWGLLYFVKFVKYAYLDPSEMVERYFISRSRLIPSQNVLKQLYYKDLNNEFIKHIRKSVKQVLSEYGDSFEMIRNTPVRGGDGETAKDGVENFENVLNFAREIEEKMSGATAPSATPTAQSGMIHIGSSRGMATTKPDLQLRQVENGFLEKRLNFVLEPVDARLADQLVDAAHFVTKLFRVPEIEFRANNDLECELHYGIIRSKNQIICLRSLAWTVAQMMYEAGRDLRDVTQQDVYRANDIVEQCDRNNYKKSGAFPTLCSMPVDEGMYIPAYQEYIFFAQELMPEVKLGSLFSLQQELADIAPMMKVVYDILKAERRDGPVQPGSVLADALCAWSAYCFASVDAFEVVSGPPAYNFGQIKR
ncbi:MAG: hypothetical protein IIU00_03630 [Clostridia bacterium]|nr:hypothetical protein [Clostridia bacterium]